MRSMFFHIFSETSYFALFGRPSGKFLVSVRFILIICAAFYWMASLACRLTPERNKSIRSTYKHTSLLEVPKHDVYDVLTALLNLKRVELLVEGSRDLLVLQVKRLE